MDLTLILLSWSLSAIYVISFSWYLAYFREKSVLTVRRIRVTLLTGVIFHTCYLVLLTISLGHIPVSGIFTVLTTCSWFFVIVYLILEIRLKEVVMGVFFMPIVIILQTISNIFIDPTKPIDPLLTDLLFEVHVALMISAYAAFSISFISSTMYILLSREMQSKKLGIFFARLPSLEFFDTLNNQAVNIGLMLVSVGIALGVYMGSHVWEGGWMSDPKLLAVIVSWAIYFTHFITRKSIGWRGMRSAYVSVIGYNWLLFSFLVVNLFSTFHNFQ